MLKTNPPGENNEAGCNTRSHTLFENPMQDLRSLSPDPPTQDRLPPNGTTVLARFSGAAQDTGLQIPLNGLGTTHATTAAPLVPVH